LFVESPTKAANRVNQKRYTQCTLVCTRRASVVFNALAALGECKEQMEGEYYCDQKNNSMQYREATYSEKREALFIVSWWERLYRM
jgi:hypothetical protein